ncbi:MAG: metallophosphatase [Snowella sp.]|nr:metallophosphatase [Snowella sp.]
MWAILTGIQGNLQAYEAVLRDMASQPWEVEELYILGDFIGPTPDSERLTQRLRSPSADELSPQICRGWWEEQCLILHSLGATGEPTELIERYGMDKVKQLWDSVSRETVEWLRRLDYGFVELDCLLIHGSSVSVSEELTPETSPWILLDRMQRMGVNNLFCGRSGKIFEYSLEDACLNSIVTTLDSSSAPQTLTVSGKRAIGVGSVGRIPGQADYTLYNPNTNQVKFRTILY